MSIRCVCPNGHVLKVKESLAGTVGLCPACRARVTVPKLKKADMSEDAILHLLKEGPPSPHQDTQRIQAFSDTSLSDFSEQVKPKKSCDRCNRSVPLESHICPHCHTYIASLKDF